MKGRLSESKIRHLAGGTVFSRGIAYFEKGAIFNAIVQGQALRAECEGRHDAYQVYAKLDNTTVKNISCTCYYSRGSRMCKHLVALCLTWINNPSEFRSVEPLDKLLQERSKEDLIGLISTLIDRQPRLLDLIELALQTPDKNDDLSPEMYRRFVRLAWKQRPWEISLELDKLLEIPKKLEKSGNWTAAGNIFNIFLDECVSLYDPDYDEEGDVAMSVDEFVSELARCVVHVNGPVARKKWLQTLLKAEIKDLELGGIDLAPSASDAFVKHATKEEWTILEKKIKAEIAHADGWKRGQLEQLLNRRQKRHKKTGKK